MKNLVLLLFLACLGASLSAQSPEKYHRVRVLLAGRDMVELAALGIETDHGLLERGRSFSTDFSDSELALIQKAGFQTEILIEDVSAWYAEQRQKAEVEARNGDCSGSGVPDPFDFPTPANYHPGSMGGYFTYQEMLDELDKMHTKYPNLISARVPVSDTLATHEGRPVWFVKLSDNAQVDEPEPEILFTALHHAREPNGLSQMIFFMWHLLENYALDPQVQYIVDNEEMYFVPCVNPDGYLYNESTNPQGGGLWRKNRRANLDGTFGVDLNRNYDYKWGYNDQGSSPNGNSETYRGESGFSEPETQMLRDFTLEHGFQIVLNYHTFSNLLIYPWGFNDSIAVPGFQQLAAFLTVENKYKIGTASETVGYAVNGTSDDWMYSATGTYAMTPEVGPGTYGFWPPETEIDHLNKTSFWQNLKAALCVLRYGQLTDDSPSQFGSTDLTIPFSLTRLGFLQGPLTVSITPVSANVQSVGPAQQFLLNQFEKINGDIAVKLAPGIQSGDRFTLLLTLSNGTISTSDTLHKTFGSGTQAIFTEQGNNLSKWNKENWGITNQIYVSAPSSITDSPMGDYKENESNAMTLKSPLVIPANAIGLRARFWARWSIEPDYDYVQVLASSDNQNWTPLCGSYTNSGVNSQPSDEPVYDGFQNDWVEECLDLSAFAGQNLWLRYALVSDGFQNYTGFFFDDLVVEYTNSVGTTSLPLADFVLKQNQPNPVENGQTRINWENTGNISGTGKLLISNVFGQKTAQLSVDFSTQNSLQLDTRDWPAGNYFYQILTERGTTTAQKMTVVK